MLDDGIFDIDCPVEAVKAWLEITNKIRYPIPEKEFDYWMGKYFFMKYELTDSARSAGFIDAKLVFY